jgi:purine nucleoside phosphorylase
MLDPCSITTGNPFIDGPMSRFTFLYEEGETKVSYSFHNIYCPEIVEHFKQFVLACGFFETSIMAAMATMVEEYETMEEKRAQSSLSD